MGKLLFGILVALCLASPAGAALKFQDDFSGTTLDAAKWYTRIGCPMEAGTDNVCFSPDNVQVYGGALHLKLTAGTLGRDYDAAGIATFRHGYGWPPSIVLEEFHAPTRVEARIKFSDEPGFWGVFWSKGTDRVGPTEFDIAETRGYYPRTMLCNVHNRNNPDPTRRHIHGVLELPFNFASRFHTYWMKFKSVTEVVFGTWYQDKRLVCGRVTDVWNTDAIGLILEAKTSSTWGGVGGPPGDSELQVDWVRAYG